MAQDKSGMMDTFHIRIHDLSSELQRITVRVLSLQKFTRNHEQERALERRYFQRKVFSRILESVQPAQTYTPPPPKVKPQIKTIEIKLSFPNLPNPSSLLVFLRRLPHLSRRLVSRRVGVVLAVLIITVVVIHLHNSNPVVPADKTNAAAIPRPTLTKGTPKYATVVPAGKSIQSLGGWTRISPPNRDPVYAYADKIDGVQINVSEQPLPANFLSDTANQIAQLAEGFGATGKFTVGSTPVYIGTSVNGPQSLILSKSKLLILIKSTTPLSNNKWAAYISSLK